jgi:hypothetical protein
MIDLEVINEIKVYKCLRIETEILLKDPDGQYVLITECAGCSKSTCCPNTDWHLPNCQLRFLTDEDAQELLDR